MTASATKERTCDLAGGLDWEVEAALAWHDEDARATIATLLLDCKHLREQLAMAEQAMSRGLTRGWKPTYQRPDE